MATANKRVIYVGGLAEEVDEKVIQVNFYVCHGGSQNHRSIKAHV